MPIVVPKALPAYEILKDESVFVMAKLRAQKQDIRPLQIAIVNLMPTKETTETQLIRMLANTPIQVEMQLLHMDSHESKNTKQEHLDTFYKTLDDIKHKKFDGMIITGAPVETLEFEEVDYWEELKDIMDYSKENVFSTLHICWGAQAGLYHHFGIDKYNLDKKIFGVFSHKVNKPKSNLLVGFDEEFYAPHSRHTQIDIEDIRKVNDLEILAESKEAGAYIVATKDNRQIFVQGHAEYDKYTLRKEYIRDKERGIDINIPENYFVDNDPSKDVVVRWKSHSNLMFSNWLNYCIYQETPYDISMIGKK